MHTRYAPVRRSLAPERTIPLGLHVLSLPLAFILSQDQTLHCNFLLVLLPMFLQLRISYSSIIQGLTSFYSAIFSSVYFIISNELLILAIPLGICGCKGNTYFLTNKFYFENFQSFYFNKSILLSLQNSFRNRFAKIILISKLANLFLNKFCRYISPYVNFNTTRLSY